MKKKLLGIALLVVLLIGVLALSASAEGTLGTVMSITINDLDEPVPGELIDFDATPHRENLYEIANNGYGVFWYDETDDGEELLWNEYPVYTKGHDYRVRVYVEPKAGYEFAEDPSTMTAFIGDKVAHVYKDSNGYFVQLYYDTCGTSAEGTLGTVMNITINDLDEPVPGELIDFDATPHRENFYEIANNGYGVFWYDETDDGEELLWNEYPVYTKGHDYRVRVYVEPKAGYEFAEDPSTMTAFIGDKAANVYKDSNGYFVQLYYDTCGTIENIDIFFEYPSQGEAPSFEKIDTARYYSYGNVSPEVNGVKWYDVTDGKYLISGTGAKFICGHTYKVTFTLRASDDCEFGNAEAYVNGKAAILDWCNSDFVTVTYEFDKLGDGHNYEEVVTKATTSKNGKIETKCSACGDVSSTKTIAKIASVTLSNENYIYDGKNKTPKVTVKDADGNTLVKNVDYKTSVASKRSGIGRYTVKVTFIGNYSGSKNVYFYIKTGKPATVKSASQTTSSVKLSWSAVPGAAGYTVYRYSPSKKAYVKAGTTEGTSFTVSKLYAGTKYTFRVVSYGKTSAGKVYDSDVYALLKTATKTKTPELTKVTASSTKGKAYVYHSNVSGETGYTVYYSTSKDSGFKKYANFKADTTRCDITGLTSGKTYYFKVRTYITTNSGYVYSAWSAVKSVKVK